MKPYLIIIFTSLISTFLYGSGKMMRFDNFEHIPGSPTQRITSLAQDRTGFLWMTTENDLLRFDGKEFVSYIDQKQNYFLVPGKIVDPLFVDSKGNLWVTAKTGVYRYNDTIDSFVDYPLPLTPLSTKISEIVHKIVEDVNTSQLYFLAEDGVVYTLKNGTLQTILNLPVTGSKFMAIDDHQNLWITAGNTLFCFNTATNFTTQFILDPDITQDEIEIWDMAIDGSFIYIAGLKSEFLKFDPSNQTLVKLTHNTTTKNYYCILRDEKGKMWIGSGSGLNYYDPITHKNIIYEPDPINRKSLTSATITSLFYDNQGNLWLGTEKGLNVSYKDQQFDYFGFTYGNLSRDANVTSFLKDRHGNLWVGYAYGGIDVFDSEFKHIRSINGLPGLLPYEEFSNVFCMYEDKKGLIWIGTYLHGMISYDPVTGHFRQFYPDGKKGSIKGAEVRSITPDEQENFWIAKHWVGVDYFNKGDQIFSHFPGNIIELPEYLSSKWPYTTFIDRIGNLWVGSNYGATCYDIKKNRVRVFHKNGSEGYQISDNDVYEIFEDSKGRIWLGTSFGLNMIDGENIKIFTMHDGLLNNLITGIKEDRQGRIWVSTRKGLSCISDITENSFKIKNYNRQNGLEIDHFMIYSRYTCKEGYFYFGGIDGFVVFHPDSLKETREEFPLVFTNFYLFNKPVGIDPTGDKMGSFSLPKNINYLDMIVLKEKYNHFTISFAALNLTRSFNNRYSYKLEGFDTEWIYAGNSNSASYTNLNPGTYVLKIRAITIDGSKSDKTLMLTIKVMPPFWKSNYAVVLYALIIILSIVAIIHFAKERERIRVQIEQKDILDSLKTQFFVNISHELKTPLTLISSPLRNILEKGKDNKSILVESSDIKSVYRNVLRLLRMAAQVLDFRKIELKKIALKEAKGDIIPFLSSIITYFDYLAHDKNVEIVLNYNKDEDLYFYFDPDKMDKIIYNVLSNALKYSPEHSKVNIYVKGEMHRFPDNKKEKKGIRVDIEDSGPGIEKSRMGSIFEIFSSNMLSGNHSGLGTGVGLSIVKEFTELHKGVVQIQSPYSAMDGKLKGGVRVSLIFQKEKNIEEVANVSAIQERYHEIIRENLLTVINKHGGAIENEDICYDDNHSSGFKVLIIEDDPELRKMLIKEFEKFHQVIEAKDGESGVKLAMETIPDLVITDVMMPGIDGYQVVSVLKQTEQTSHIPIILLTAKTMHSDEIMAYSTGADAFMKKPFHTSTLLHLADTLIENRLKLKKKFFSNFGFELIKSVPTATDEKFMEKLLKLINDNISDPSLGIDLLTKELYMSRAQLYKKVNAVANTSVKIFIRKIRLKRAAEILVSENLPVTDVAWAVGFDSLPYFSKCFQEEFGISPSKYALNVKN